jgi:hypothetical protein
VGIAVAGIVNLRLAQRREGFTGEDGVLTFHLQRKAGVRRIGGRRRSTAPISRRESRFIKRFLNRLDRLTGLSFQAVRNRREALMDIYSLRSYPNRSVIGSTYFTEEGYDVTWKNIERGRIGAGEKVTIKHEILHVLGLDHPYGNGYNFFYDTSDTLMSYYTRRGFYGLTDSDRAALVSLWGSESPMA